MTLETHDTAHHENGGRPATPRTRTAGRDFAGTDLAPLAQANLDSVCRSVMDLAKAAPRPPLRIKLQHGHMTVEVEWPDPEAAGVAHPAHVEGAMPPAHAAHAGTDGLNGYHGAANGYHGPAPAALPEDGHLRPPAGPAAPHPAPDEALRYLCAPTVGTFYYAPEPGAAPFVAVGDVVRPGQPIGILEVMKMMSTVEADAAGRVVEFLVPDGHPVEFQQRLLALEPVTGTSAGTGPGSGRER